MTAPAASLAWARGTLARFEGKPVADCPYAFTPSGLRESALGLIWAAAWRHAGDETPPVKQRRPHGAKWARDLVGRRKVGRGRSKLGPRREWDAVELAALELALQSAWEPARIAVVVGRTTQAVKNRIDRQAKKMARAA